MPDLKRWYVVMAASMVAAILLAAAVYRLAALCGVHREVRSWVERRSLVLAENPPPCSPCPRRAVALGNSKVLNQGGRTACVS